MPPPPSFPDRHEKHERTALQPPQAPREGFNVSPVHVPLPCALSRAAPQAAAAMQSAAFSAVIITAALMLTVMSEGNTEASAMNKPSSP